MRNKLFVACLLLVAWAPAAGGMEIGTGFWDVGWGGERNDPFIDGFENVGGENPWKPELLDEIKVYTVFRFMDWGKTNNAVKAHTGGTRWADRVKKSDRVQRPVAYEWMIDLFLHYTHNGSHSSGNSWGAKRFIGEPAEEAHRYRALDYAIETGQYDPETGAVQRVSGMDNARK